MSKGKQPQAAEFGLYLRRLMDAAGFDTDADLSRATGIDGSLLSKWWSGTSRPTIESLRRIAPPLGVRLGDLMVKAGIASAEELGMAGEPPTPPPTAPQDPLLRRVARSLADDRVPADLRDKLRRGVQIAYESWQDWLATLGQDSMPVDRRSTRR